MTIKVVRGNPTPEELAAALAVVRARAVTAAAPPSGAPGPRDSWADPSRIAAQGVPHPGPSA
ncbi:acyl-CoA carboxylase epsilon subunit, partial [Kitasatospora sp. NPDC018614]